MKVLHICHNYLSTSVYKNLFDAQEKIGVENIVYLPSKYTKKEKPRHNAIVFNCSYRLNSIFFLYKQWLVFNDIQKKVDLSEIDVIHAHMVFVSGFAAYKLHKKYNKPLIITVRNTDINGFYKKLRFKYLRFLGDVILSAASKVVFLSPQYQAQLFNKYIKKNIDLLVYKSCVIPNGIDNYFLKNKAEKAVELTKTRVINLIYVGSINKNKNLEMVVKAAKQLIRENYVVNLKVVGEIQDKQYTKLIKENKFITYYSRCTKEEVCNHLRDSEIFILLSHTETFGLVYAEAISQGLPVIYTRGQGFDGHFEEGEVGYSVDENNLEEITDKIKLIKSNYKNISSNCIQNSENFDWNKIAVKYRELYSEAIKEYNRKNNY